jgi:tetratricopeptide (TPR) repeat protein
MRLIALVCAAGILAPASAALAGSGAARKGDKIAITTASEEARKLYLEGRDLAEKLRATDAHTRYQAAVEKDPGFALGWLGMANTSVTAQEFFDDLRKAMALADKVSDGERMLIQLADAGARGDTARQTALGNRLVAAYPRDERARNLLGGIYFGRQQWAKAVAEYRKAIEIEPKFSQPYNQMGYALRFLEKYGDAEKAFQQYIELIPDDPNPYDSYAELLMKMGRFDESIKQYEKALSVDKNFVASYVGIGNDQMFMGKPEEARASFARLASVARNDGERRQALFWTSQTWVLEGQTDKALAEIARMTAIAEKNKDLPAISGDHFNAAEILLEAGRPDEALARFKKQYEAQVAADVPQPVKDQAERNMLYNEAKVALAKGDLAKAKANAAVREKKVNVNKVTFEVQQIHELRGRIALEEKKYAVAAAELAQANQQNARVLYLLGLAHQGKGDAKAARAAFTRAADFNGLGGNYVMVRQKARDALARS